MRKSIGNLFGGIRLRGTGVPGGGGSGRRRSASPSGGRSSGT